MESISYVIIAKSGREVMAFDTLEKARERKRDFQRIKERKITERIIE
jgi:hypothetical protein